MRPSGRGYLDLVSISKMHQPAVWLGAHDRTSLRGLVRQACVLFEHVALVRCLHAPRCSLAELDTLTIRGCGATAHNELISVLGRPSRSKPRSCSLPASCRWHPASCEQLHSSPFLLYNLLTSFAVLLKICC
ncbi:hypothetical protein MRX96_001186 [Rhipicephalus microplus]